MEQRISDLHSHLHITSRQSQFAQAMRDSRNEVDTLYRQRAKKLRSMSAVQNMQSYAEIEEQRVPQTQTPVPAFQALYDSMSDQQKADADRVFHQAAQQ